jgi:glycogen synthase
MAIQNVLVTGQSLYLERFKYLFKAMAQNFDRLEYLPLVDMLRPNSYVDKIARKVNGALYHATCLERFAPPDALKSAVSFQARSRFTEQQIRQLETPPDIIFHIFCLSSPLWERFDIPYAMFLDYTMALAKRNWPSWSPFHTIKDYNAWLSCERLTYQHAHHLFCVSRQIKASLMQDYGLPAEKITVTGSSANFAHVYAGEKQFGSKQMMFNGSDFERKGGDLVLSAFRQVREVIPEATLVIFGAKVPIVEEGIKNPGHIRSREEMQRYLLETDLVLAPARCDPFPVFPMEAMSFGVPCIVSGCDGNPDIVDNGLNGVLIENPTPDALAQKMLLLLNQPATLQAMSEQARRKIQTTLNWQRVAQIISECLLSTSIKN